jgi:hypothetical protein
MSIIGKKYIPSDNSWAVNITKAGDYPYKSEQSHLAGTYNTNPKTTIIVSEPFMCNTLTTVRKDSKHKHLMILVEFQEETHAVLYDASNIVD